MEIFIRPELSNEENTAVHSLLSVCQKAESLTLSFPYDDQESLYFLGYEDSTLVCVLVLCEIDENIYESIAWTLPDYRRRGYFRAMWDRAKQYLKNGLYPDEKVYVHFIIDHRSPSAEKSIAALNAEKLSEEYMMSVKLPGTACPPPESDERSAFSIRLFREEAGGIERYAVRRRGNEEAEPVVTFSVIPDHTGKNCYLYEFFVRKDLRGQGLGSRIFPLILLHLQEEGYRMLSLQVSSVNEAAVRIYKNSGLTAGVVLTYYETAI